MDQPHSSSLTLLDEESADQIPLIPAPPLSIFINQYAFNIDSQLTSPVIDLELWNDSFAAPENRPISYKAPPLSIPLTYQPIQFFISGELAQRPLKKYDSRIDELLPYKIHSSEPVYVTYKVHIDSSGLVFWYEIERTTGNNQANALAEELLLSLEFAPSKLNSNSTGIIDFVISIF